MYTSHGWPIPGSGDDPKPEGKKERCGGPGVCPDCSAEAAGYDDRDIPENAEPVKIREDGIIEG